MIDDHQGPSAERATLLVRTADGILGTHRADLDHEEAVQALQGHRTVHVEEVGRKHRRGLRAQEIPPRRIGAPLGRRRDLQRLEDPAVVDALTRWPTLSSSPWIL
jgi:hypothetical protein